MKAFQARSIGGRLFLLSSLLVPTLITHIAINSAFAQAITARLSGTVLDHTGAVIPNARVVVRNTASDDTRTTTSNGSGVFNFDALPTGDYAVKITVNGFQTFTATGIHLTPNASVEVRDIKMVVGSAAQTVTVNANTQIDTESGEDSSLITAKDISHLSVEGRDVTELFKTLPGFAIVNTNNNLNNSPYDPSQTTVSGALGNYSANGSPVAGVNLLSDGANLTDPGNFGAATQNVNYDMTQEVKVDVSNFGADEADGPVVVNAVGKSGGAQYHGELYTYGRTYQLNSEDALQGALGQPKPPDHEVYPGFNLGGPIIIPHTNFNHSRKLTFWAGAEDYAQRNVYAYGSAGSAVVHALVPTAGMRQGDFSAAQLSQYLGPNYTPSIYAPSGAVLACNGPDANICATPQNGSNGTPVANGQIGPYLDPGAKALLNALPLPNQPTNSSNFNYATTNLIDNDLWQARGRIDYALSDKTKFFAVYNTERGKEGVPQVEYYSPTGSLGGDNTPGGGLLSTLNSQSGSFDLTTIFSPTLTNELIGEGSYLLQAFVAKTPADFAASAIGYPYLGAFSHNGSSLFPQLADYGNDGLPVALDPDLSLGPIFAKKWTRGGEDNLTKLLGTHTLKLGFYAQLSNNNEVEPFGITNGEIQNYFQPASFSFNGQTFYGSGYTNPATVNGAALGPNGGNYLADFSEGAVGDFEQTNLTPVANLYFWDIDGYVQDSWKTTPNLTLNFGVRFQHYTPWEDAHNVGVPVWNPALVNTGVSASNPYPGFEWHAIDHSVPNGGLSTAWAYVEPRVGFAWDISKVGATVLRGGFGVYRAHDSWNDATIGLGFVQGQETVNTGQATLAGISRLNYAQGAAGTGVSVSIPGFGFSQNDNQQPETYNYSLALNQKMPFNSVFSIAYAGNYSSHILDDGDDSNGTGPWLDNANAVQIGGYFKPDPDLQSPSYGQTIPQYTLGTLPNSGPANTLNLFNWAPYPQYAVIHNPTHQLYSNYNSLQVGWVKQTGHLLFNTNYTFSRVMGVRGGYEEGDAADPFNHHHDYGPLAFDRTNILNLSLTYSTGVWLHKRIAGGFLNNWEVDNITNLMSGYNIQADTSSGGSPNLELTGNLGATNTVTATNIEFLGTQDVSLQPVVTCNPVGNHGQHQYINSSCFSLPSQYGTNGTYIFPYLRSPAYFDSDLTVVKNIPLKESQSLQFRAAAFNFLNHPLSTLSSSFENEYQLIFDNQAAGTAGPTTSPASATLQNPEFGKLQYKTGRRIMELAVKYYF
jgi:Carboxypeptidase regulatory-like domain